MNLLYIMYDIWGGNAFCWPVCEHYSWIVFLVKKFFDFLFYLKYFCFLLISRRSSYRYFYLKKFCFCLTCEHYSWIVFLVKKFFDFLFYLKYFCFLHISLGSSYRYFYLKKFCFYWLHDIIQISKKSKRFFNLYTVVVYLLYILLYYINNIYNIFIYRGFCLLSPIEYHDKYSTTRGKVKYFYKNKQNGKIFKI